MLVSCRSLIAALLHDFRSPFILYIVTFCFLSYSAYNIRVRLLLYHLKDMCELYIYHKELIGIPKAKEKLFHMLKNQVFFLHFKSNRVCASFSGQRSGAEFSTVLCVLFIDPLKEQQPGKGKGLTEFCYWLQEKELVLMQQGARKGNKRKKYKEN